MEPKISYENINVYILEYKGKNIYQIKTYDKNSLDLKNENLFNYLINFIFIYRTIKENIYLIPKTKKVSQFVLYNPYRTIY